jgi:hypothetical protein
MKNSIGSFAINSMMYLIFRAVDGRFSNDSVEDELSEWISRFDDLYESESDENQQSIYEDARNELREGPYLSEPISELYIHQWDRFMDRLYLFKGFENRAEAENESAFMRMIYKALDSIWSEYQDNFSKEESS